MKYALEHTYSTSLSHLPNLPKSNFHAGCLGLWEWRLILTFLVKLGHSGSLRFGRWLLCLGGVGSCEGGGGQMTTAPASDRLSGKAVQSTQLLVMGSKYSTCAIVTWKISKKNHVHKIKISSQYLKRRTKNNNDYNKEIYSKNTPFWRSIPLTNVNDNPYLGSVKIIDFTSLITTYDIQKRVCCCNSWTCSAHRHGRTLKPFILLINKNKFITTKTLYHINAGPLITITPKLAYTWKTRKRLHIQYLLKGVSLHWCKNIVPVGTSYNIKETI